MAIIAVLFGGIIGFASFVMALVAFDASFLAACGIYMLAGFATTASMIALSLIPTRSGEPEAQNALSA